MSFRRNSWVATSTSRCSCMKFVNLVPCPVVPGRVLQLYSGAADHATGTSRPGITLPEGLTAAMAAIWSASSSPAAAAALERA